MLHIAESLLDSSRAKLPSRISGILLALILVQYTG